MSLFFGLLVLICLLYYVLREMRRLWIRRRLPQWTVVFGGVVAWAFVLSLGGWGVSLLWLLVRALSGDVAALASATSAALFTGFVLHYREMLDLESVTDFVKESLAFRNYERRRTNIFGEVEQRKIDKVHQELGSDPESTFAKPKVVRPGNPERLRREAEQLISHIPTSPNLAAELALLRKHQTVDITDSWRLNCLQKLPHPLAHHVMKTVLDAASGCLAIDLLNDTLEASVLIDHRRLHRLKQDLYDFFHALIHEPWMSPYVGFITLISCSCFCTTVDSFGISTTEPLLRVEISVKTIRAFAARVYDVRDLSTTILHKK